MMLEELNAIRRRWEGLRHAAPGWFQEDMHRILTWLEHEPYRLSEARARGAEAMQMEAIKALAFLWDHGAANLVAKLDAQAHRSES